MVRAGALIQDAVRRFRSNVLGIVLAALAAMPVHAQDKPATLSESYGDWVINCVAGGKDTSARICQMTQELRDNQSGQRVLLLAINPADAGSDASGGTLIAPFGLKLADGIRITADQMDLIKAPFSTCLPHGCIVPLALNSKLLTAFAAAKSWAVVMTAQQTGKPFTTAISINGFKAAAKRLAELHAGA